MRISILALFAVLLLSGCASDAQKGLCPTAAVLAPVSALTVFRENAPADPSGELYSVWMTNVKTECKYDKEKKTTESSLRIFLSAKRAPTGQTANYRVPYFVTVTHGGDRIMTKKMYTTDISFPAGDATVSFVQPVQFIDIALSRGAKLGEYQILTGFQLTQAQLDYNTKNYHFAP
jgi:hypothetical protein